MLLPFQSAGLAFYQLRVKNRGWGKLSRKGVPLENSDKPPVGMVGMVTLFPVKKYKIVSEYKPHK